jgi:hypothetical protein
VIIELPTTNDACLSEVGRLTREMGAEWREWGASERWRQLFDQKERVKDHRRALLDGKRLDQG